MLLPHRSQTKLYLTAYYPPQPPPPPPPYLHILQADVSSSSSITGGLLILSNTAIAGFIEASPRKLYALLGSFSSSPLLSSVRIVANVEDAPERSFKHFGVYSANPPGSGDVDVDAESPAVVAGEVLKSLQAVPFPEGSEGIVGLGKSAPSDIPTAAKVLGCSDCQAYPTLEEYLELFASPVSVEVESEMVWPLQSAVSWT